MSSAEETWDTTEWGQSIKKARQNLDVAEMLIKQQIISLSAFHVQQCVELSIKAVVYKFGFEQHLQKRKVVKSHIPAGELFFEVCHFIEDQLKTIDQTKFDNEFSSLISEAVSELKQITDLLCEAKSQQSEKFVELWLHSLGIGTSEWIATALESYKKCFSTKLAQQLVAGTLVLAQEFLAKLIKFRHKNRQKHIIYAAKEKTRKMFLKHGLTDELVDAFFGAESEFKKMVLSEINRYDFVKIMDLILKPNGLLSELNAISHPQSLKLDINECIKFIWIAHLATISPTAILLYPHVIIGRYPRTVSVKSQNLEIIPEHTEVLYPKHTTAISKLIDEARCTMERVQLILNARTDD